MPRHPSYVPHGVIPAVLLPFNDDLSIDEKNFRSHLRDVAAVTGISAITINAHSTEVASCSFDEQRRVLAIQICHGYASRSARTQRRKSQVERLARRFNPMAHLRSSKSGATTIASL